MSTARNRDNLVLLPKQPTTPLAGPYGHPVHPMLVPIPIGTWVASLVFDIASLSAEDPAVFAIGSRWLIGIGLLGAVGAAIFGLMDLIGIPRGTPAFRTGVTHMTFNLIVTGVFAVSFAVRLAQVPPTNISVGMIVVSAAAIGLLAVSGWLGGRLAYRYGIRVADQRAQTEGYR